MVMVPKKPHQGNDRGKRKPRHRILHLGSRFTALLALAFWVVTVPNAWAGAQGNHAAVGSDCNSNGPSARTQPLRPSHHPHAPGCSEACREIQSAISGSGDGRKTCS